MRMKSNRFTVVLILCFIVAAAAFVPWGNEEQQNYDAAMHIYPATLSVQVLMQAILLACAVISLVVIAISTKKSLVERRPLLLRLMAVNAANLAVTLVGFVASVHHVMTYGLSGNGIFGALSAATLVVALMAFIAAMILHNRSFTFQCRKTTIEQEKVDERRSGG